MIHRYGLLYVLLVAGLCLYPLIVQAQVPSESEIKARLDQPDLKESEKNIPDNQFVLLDELRKTDDELADRRATLSFYERADRTLDQLKTQASKLIQDIDALKCGAVVGTKPAALAINLENLSFRIRAALSGFSEDISPWDPPGIDERGLSPNVVCKRLKDFVSDQTKRQALLSFFDNKRKELETNRKQLTLLIDALQKRRAALVQHLSAATTQQTLGSYLWAIILVIGLLSIGTILVVKTFSPDLQEEWVASGQVIQFVTVMILLSVIMGLGLAGILKENTLGTLLGGIAGYVLSQGVGRAAARAVTRGLATVPTTVTSVSPTTGPAAGGTQVTIRGTGFRTGATVTFGGVAATIASVNDTSIRATALAHPTGTVDVVVTNSDGATATLPGAFTYQ